jgi:hypothetical protein
MAFAPSRAEAGSLRHCLGALLAIECLFASGGAFGASRCVQDGDRALSV